MAAPFQPSVPLNQAIFNACDALAIIAGTERPIAGVDPIWQIQKKGCAAIVAMQLAGQAGGTVTSVGLAVPTGFTVVNSPVTNAGVLQVSYATGQAQRRFLATPSSGTGAMSLREITLADLPDGIGAVESVNGQTGAVSLITSNVPDVFDYRYVTDAQLAAIDAIESILTISALESYSEFTYNIDGDLEQKEIYSNSGMGTLLYTINYSYTLGNLTNVEVIRNSDSFTYNKIYSYDLSGNLQSKEIAA